MFQVAAGATTAVHHAPVRLGESRAPRQPERLGLGLPAESQPHRDGLRLASVPAKLEISSCHGPSATGTPGPAAGHSARRASSKA